MDVKPAIPLWIDETEIGKLPFLLDYTRLPTGKKAQKSALDKELLLDYSQRCFGEVHYKGDSILLRKGGDRQGGSEEGIQSA